MRRFLLAVLAVGVVMGVWGCLPEDMPAYTGDGKTVAAVARDGGNMPSLWTYDVGSKSVKSHALPSNDMSDVRCIGGDVWVGSDTSSARFDPATGKFVDGPEELKWRHWVRNAALGSWDGKPSIFLPVDESHPDTFEIYSYPELKKIKAKQPGSVKGAGNNWWVLVQDGTVTVFDAKTRVAGTIAAKELEKAGDPEGDLMYARVSGDGKTLLLVTPFGKGGSDVSVFNLGTGKFLWHDFNYRIGGVPLIVKEDEIWAIDSNIFDEVKDSKALSVPPTTMPDDKPQCLVLSRYTGGGGEDIRAKRDVVFIRPLRAKETTIGQFAPSPDGSQFLVVINGEEPKLLMIPIKADVKARDVTEIRLEEKAAGTRP